ncbi:hypothetical protein AAG570_003592 [Ranatra chinensis]|uniref:Uncharacterized protein n=1 Tax=Ranatra chinensis TaxID=642074 RepID=A0ABD0YGM0_9HEMI
MASKRRNMFYGNKKQETTEIVFQVPLERLKRLPISAKCIAGVSIDLSVLLAKHPIKFEKGGKFHVPVSVVSYGHPQEHVPALARHLQLERLRVITAQRKPDQFRFGDPAWWGRSRGGLAVNGVPQSLVGRSPSPSPPGIVTDHRAPLHLSSYLRPQTSHRAIFSFNPTRDPMRQDGGMTAGKGPALPAQFTGLHDIQSQKDGKLHVPVSLVSYCTVITRSHLMLKMAPKHQNMFYQNKKQETTEIGKCDLPSFIK